MSRILDAIGPDARATVLVEVTDAEDEGYPLPGNHDVRWLHRGAQPATRSLLEEAVRGLTLPDGPGLLWFSGEADSLRPVRRYLRRELQLDPSWVAWTATGSAASPSTTTTPRSTPRILSSFTAAEASPPNPRRAGP